MYSLLTIKMNYKSFDCTLKKIRYQEGFSEGFKTRQPFEETIIETKCTTDLNMNEILQVFTPANLTALNAKAVRPAMVCQTDKQAEPGGI